MRPFSLVFIALVWGACSGDALAYRPFDGTDAGVAKAGEWELELQPAGYLWSGHARTLIAPAATLNYGISKGWEAVIAGRLESPTHPGGPTRLADGVVSVKTVLHEGSLQDAVGPSVAGEVALLLPEVHGDAGTGVSAAVIVSQRWTAATVHLNAEIERTRDGLTAVSLGSIVEGPADWRVRPVAEVQFERAFGDSRQLSALVGAIWEVKENLAIDAAYRHGWATGHRENEIRLGLTATF